MAIHDMTGQLSSTVRILSLINFFISFLYNNMCTYKAMNTDHFGIPKTDLEESLLTLVNLFSSVNLCARIF